MCKSLIHAVCRGYAVTAYKWYLSKLKKPLNSAVFTVLSVKDWENNVNFYILIFAVFAKSDKALVKRVRAENAWNIIRVLFPFV